MPSKKDQILSATRELIFNNGLQSVSMSLIGKTAKVGMGTIYNYFPTKEDLVNALFDQVSQQLSQEVTKPYDKDADTLQNLERLCRSLIEFGLTYPQEIMLFEQLNHSPYIRPEVQARDYGIKAIFFQLIEAGQAEGKIKMMPAALIGSAQISWATTLIRTHSRGEALLTPTLMTQAVEAWLDFVKRS